MCETKVYTTPVNSMVTKGRTNFGVTTYRSAFSCESFLQNTLTKVYSTFQSQTLFQTHD